MPAYTHLQRAEPVLVAHWLLAYVEMFLRDADRLADCRKRLNLCPLGSGAVAGATLPLDRRAMAADLGFDVPTANSIDATSDRDFVLEFVNALSMLALHLSRWAEEMILFSSQEFGFVHLPEAYSTGSSAMPQKKNPDLLELTRGKAGRVIGDATALLITVKGLPLAYNKDLQETQEPLFDATDTVLSLLPLVTGWMKAVEFNHERMQAAAQSGFMNAWAAATYLVQRGVPFRLAHEQIGKAVQACIEKKCELARSVAGGIALAESGLRSGFLFLPEPAVSAAISRCSRRHGSGASQASTGGGQTKSGIHAGGSPCARVKPDLPDAEQIHELIAAYSGDGTLLPRTFAEICENVRDFVVLEDRGQIIGCGALHLYGPHLAEIRSITVDPSRQGSGGGERLVKALLVAGQETQCQLHLSVHPHPGILRAPGFCHGAARGSAGQDPQRLLRMSPLPAVRRSCHGAR